MLLLTLPHLAGRIGRVDISGIRIYTADALEVDVVGYSHVIALPLEGFQLLPPPHPLHLLTLLALP